MTREYTNGLEIDSLLGDLRDLADSASRAADAVEHAVSNCDAAEHAVEQQQMEDAVAFWQEAAYKLRNAAYYIDGPPRPSDLSAGCHFLAEKFETMQP